MSMTDPYFVVKDEVNKALNHTKALFQHWQMLNSERQTSSPDEIQRTTADLRNCIKSIEWDLEDLEDTIGIVEKNPSRFRINQSELVERQNFVRETKREIEKIRENVMGAIGSQKIDQPTPLKSIGQAACRPLRDTLRNISAGYVPIPTKGDSYEERSSEKMAGSETKFGKKTSQDESFVLESKDSPSQQDDSPIHVNHNVADFELLESDEQALMQAGLAENAMGTNNGPLRPSRGRSFLRIKFRGGHFHRIIAGVFAVITVVTVTVLLYVFL